MKQEKPIKQPYEAPENYFVDFNTRVMQKIEAEKRVQSRFSFSFRRSYAYAAAVAAILIFVGIGLYKGLNTTEDSGKKIVENAKKDLKPDSLLMKPNASHEDAVIQQWVEEAEQKPVVAVNESQKSKEELSVEQELEAEGLIVMDVETAWLDENEILP
jgi:hypothetical protein